MYNAIQYTIEIFLNALDMTYLFFLNTYKVDLDQGYYVGTRLDQSLYYFCGWGGGVGGCDMLISQ